MSLTISSSVIASTTKLNCSIEQWIASDDKVTLKCSFGSDARSRTQIWLMFDLCIPKEYEQLKDLIQWDPKETNLKNALNEAENRDVEIRFEAR